MLRMRTLTVIAAFAALAAGGVALAKKGPASASAVSSSITATTGSVNVKTCTATDGTIERVKGTYTGTATGSVPVLTGPFSARVDSWYNMATNIGQLSAKLSIGAGTTGAMAKLEAVNNNGSITGWVRGRTTDGKKLTGTASGAWTKTGGFTSLQIGAGSGTNFAFTSSGKCTNGFATTGATGATGPTGPTGATSALAVKKEKKKK